MKEDKYPLSDEENEELMNYLGHICEMVERVWKRSKNTKPCFFDMNINGECYSIKVEKTNPFDGIDSYIEVTKCES